MAKVTIKGTGNIKTIKGGGTLSEPLIGTAEVFKPIKGMSKVTVLFEREFGGFLTDVGSYSINGGYLF